MNELDGGAGKQRNSLKRASSGAAATSIPSRQVGEKPFTSLSPGPVDERSTPRVGSLDAPVHVDQTTEVQVVDAYALDAPFLDTVAARIIDARNANADVWCIFDNTARGEAVPNALTLMENIERMAG